MYMRSCKLLIAATGSAAAMKVPCLIKSLMELINDEVHVIVTENAKHFFKISDLPQNVRVYDDALEWHSWRRKGDPVLHIELGKLADIMIVAPLNANTLAKISHGISDNLLTSTIRAWDINKPLIFCPSMSGKMWEHPVTTQQISTLKQWGFIEIPPVVRKMVCGEIGPGAMADVKSIVTGIIKVVDSKFNNRI